jgi:hypothetical protein
MQSVEDSSADGVPESAFHQWNRIKSTSLSRGIARFTFRLRRRRCARR